jgi:hypothetical protein
MPISPAPRAASLAARISLILAGAVLVSSSAAIAKPGQAAASSDGSVPSGLVVVIANKPQKAGSLDLRALQNPSISGVAFQVHWADLEPVEGQPDWSKLDELFAGAVSAKKWVQLLIFPGFFSPAWALDGVQTESFAIQYGPGRGTVKTLPMPWDKTYLNRWFAFLKLLSARYGTSPAFRMIAAVGPTSVSAEFTLPNSPADLKKWQRDGYRPAKYLAAWRSVFQTYAQGFPNQYVSLSVGGGVNINDQGRIAPREHLRTRQAMVGQAMSLLGRRFVLQLSDVHAGAGPHSLNSEAGEQFVLGYNGRIVTGFQMRTAAEGDSAVMGAEGNPPLALRKSIDLAMEPNSAGKRVNYLEIYEPDVLADEMQPDLRYAASLFAQGKP